MPRCPARLAAVLLGLALWLPPGFGGAEPVLRDVVPGDRIRYVSLARGGWTHARVLDVDVGSWLVRSEDRDPYSIDTSSLRRVDVFREKGPLVKEGFFIGIVPGALFGASIAGIACLDYEGPGACPGIWGRLVFAAFFGGTTGGIGALIAKVIKPEQWDTVLRGAVRVSLTPIPGPRGRGVGASVAVSF